jgi:hypothetical protein
MSLPLQPPVKPMLARPVKAIPDSAELLFEPEMGRLPVSGLP